MSTLRRCGGASVSPGERAGHREDAVGALTGRRRWLASTDNSYHPHSLFHLQSGPARVGGLSPADPRGRLVKPASPRRRLWPAPATRLYFEGSGFIPSCSRLASWASALYCYGGPRIHRPKTTNFTLDGLGGAEKSGACGTLLPRRYHFLLHTLSGVCPGPGPRRHAQRTSNPDAPF